MLLFFDAAAKLSGDVSVNDGQKIEQKKKSFFTDLGPLKETERHDLNCAVKEYLLLAGYRLTAMTFYEEVGTSVLAFFFVFLQDLSNNHPTVNISFKDLMAKERRDSNNIG